MNSLKILGSVLVAGSVLAISASVPVQAQSGQGNVCLPVTKIKSTQAVDNRTILYRMNDGTVWRNTLAAYCPTLVGFGGGSFSQETHNDMICANAQQITTKSGNVCRLGAFTRVN